MWAPGGEPQNNIVEWIVQFWRKKPLQINCKYSDFDADDNITRLRINPKTPAYWSFAAQIV